VVKRFLLSAGQKAIRLTIHTEHGLLCYGDPVKLSWVLATLINNALSCTPDGGEINFCALRDASRLRLRVSDTGPAMPPDIADTFSTAAFNGCPRIPQAAQKHSEWRSQKKSLKHLAVEYSAEGSPRGNIFTIDFPLA
jgi:signal transduction histidine kinase